MLKIEKLNFSYGQGWVLKDLSLEVGSGELLGIIGPNGSGKTTLLKLITKLLKPCSGKLLLNDTNIHKIPAKKYAKEVAYLPSIIDITFSYTVEEFVSMGRFPYTGRYGNLSISDRKIIKSTLEKYGSYPTVKNSVSSLHRLLCRNLHCSFLMNPPHTLTSDTVSGYWISSKNSILPVSQ